MAEIHAIPAKNRTAAPKEVAGADSKLMSVPMECVSNGEIVTQDTQDQNDSLAASLNEEFLNLTTNSDDDVITNDVLNQIHLNGNRESCNDEEIDIHSTKSEEKTENVKLAANFNGSPIIVSEELNVSSSEREMITNVLGECDEVPSANKLGVNGEPVESIAEQCSDDALLPSNALLPRNGMTDSFIKSVDDVPLTESYLKISLTEDSKPLDTNGSEKNALSTIIEPLAEISSSLKESGVESTPEVKGSYTDVTSMLVKQDADSHIAESVEDGNLPVEDGVSYTLAAEAVAASNEVGNLPVEDGLSSTSAAEAVVASNEGGSLPVEEDAPLILDVEAVTTYEPGKPVMSDPVTSVVSSLPVQAAIESEAVVCDIADLDVKLDPFVGKLVESCPAVGESIQEIVVDVTDLEKGAYDTVMSQSEGVPLAETNIKECSADGCILPPEVEDVHYLDSALTSTYKLSDSISDQCSVIGEAEPPADEITPGDAVIIATTKNDSPISGQSTDPIMAPVKPEALLSNLQPVVVQTVSDSALVTKAYKVDDEPLQPQGLDAAEGKNLTVTEVQTDDGSVETDEALFVATAEPDVIPDPPVEEWLDILGNGLLKKKVLVPGKGESSRPASRNIVTIRCEGKLESGTLVDKHNKLKFILSDQDVIQALDLAVGLMEDGETALVFTDAKYAYGVQGRKDMKPPIPQNSSITYEVEILSVEEGPDLKSLTDEERVRYGDQKRVRGNDLYSRDDFNGAINLYSRGIKYLEGSDNENVMNMKIKCLNNLSAAQLKVKAYKSAVASLDTVLQFEPENVKALFRKGKCLDGMKKEAEAFECIKKASSLDPSNKQLRQEMERLKSVVNATKKKEAQMYQKMFNEKPMDKLAREEEERSWTIKLLSGGVLMLGFVVGYLQWRRL